ncbi:MAG: DUF4382 domain-containing protein, partial [Flavobacteriales bacterium]|nr:DUF4382 domain-containing protein [Flavobacteriales bacterium]
MKNFVLPILVAFMLFGCKKDEKTNNSYTSSFEVRLTDIPGDYDQVNIDLQGISAHHVPDNGSAAWINIPTNVGIYDLLKLQNGIDTAVVDSMII